MKSPLTQQERFWSKAVSSGECLVWQSARDKDGYGLFQRATRTTVRAHRYAYTITHGAIPKGLLVCHRCDNPSCVKPEHLFLGTITDNNRDAWAKGRAVSFHAGQTHCKRGHEFNAENTYRHAGGRFCRECKRQSDRRKYWASKQILES